MSDGTFFIRAEQIASEHSLARIAEKEAELAALREQHARDQMLMGELAELRELQASMAALLRDKERLDWLAAATKNVLVHDSEGGWAIWTHGSDAITMRRPTLRETLDAAMREET